MNWERKVTRAQTDQWLCALDVDVQHFDLARGIDNQHGL